MEESPKFKINDLVEYYNTRTGGFHCWVVSVNKVDDRYFYDLKEINAGYNIMHVPEEYITLVKNEE